AGHGELTTEQELSIWLLRDSPDRPIRPRVELAIERAVGVEPPDMIARRGARAATESGEQATEHDRSERLNDHRRHVIVRTGIKARIQRAVGEKPPDTAARGHS